MASCALENVNVIVDDEVSFDAMFDLAKKNLKASYQEFWIPIVEKNMKYCVNQGNLLKDELLSTGDCNHLTKFIMFCMFINNMAVRSLFILFSNTIFNLLFSLFRFVQQMFGWVAMDVMS